MTSHERLSQPAIALARFGAQPFASADLGRRTQASPGDQVTRASELVESGPQFGQHNLGNALVDARHLVQHAYHVGLPARRVR